MWFKLTDSTAALFFRHISAQTVTTQRLHVHNCMYCLCLQLLEARQGVLSADELDFWRGVTIDMMSDEEDGAVEGVAGWIVRPPSFRSKELTDLCVTLQARLEANPKYTSTHHRRLHIGPDSDRNPPNAYNPDAAKKHFKEHLIPQVGWWFY